MNPNGKSLEDWKHISPQVSMTLISWCKQVTIRAKKQTQQRSVVNCSSTNGHLSLAPKVSPTDSLIKRQSNFTAEIKMFTAWCKKLFRSLWLIRFPVIAVQQYPSPSPALLLKSHFSLPLCGKHQIGGFKIYFIHQGVIASMVLRPFTKNDVLFSFWSKKRCIYTRH